MKAIVYVSCAARLFDDQELDALLVRARDRNLNEGITGLLLYAEGTFMQHLEGPESAVQRIYTAIRLDRRHHTLIELFHQKVQRREFDAWSMAYTRVDPKALQLLAGAVTSSAPRPDAGPGEYLLRRFWERQRARA